VATVLVGSSNNEWEKWDGICRRCGTSTLRFVADVSPRNDGAVRVECVKCGSFAGWKARNVSTLVKVETAAPATPPEAWLYVTRRLDLLTLPSSPLLGPTLTLGDVAYYRATPAVLRWLLAAGAALSARLGRQVAAGEIGFPESVRQARTYLAGVEAVRAFVERVYGREHVEAEQEKPGTPALPDVGMVPDR
jgi:hypothetical protein